jgi:hypothetical protein
MKYCEYGCEAGLKQGKSVVTFNPIQNSKLKIFQYTEVTLDRRQKIQ